jgi:hypothetical protein
MRGKENVYGGNKLRDFLFGDAFDFAKGNQASAPIKVWTGG